MDDDSNPDTKWVVPIILQRAREHDDLHLEGPVDTEYGWGWAPTTTFWRGHRRVHFYYELIEKYHAIEVADVSVKRVQRAAISDPEIAWEIVRRFLAESFTFEELPALAWKRDNLDHDKFIPHPPGAPNPGNIAQLIDTMKQMGAQPWEPDQETDEAPLDE